MIFDIVFGAIIGATIGSFLNMLIYRLPLGISLINPARSICPKCKNAIKWYHNIPIISYIILGSKCAYCGEKISLQYLIVELISLIITVITILFIGISMQTIWLLLFFYCLILLSFIDIKHKAVPDYLLLVLLILSLFATKIEIFKALEYGLIISGGLFLLEFLVTFYIQNIKAYITKNDELKTQKSLGEGDIIVGASFGILLGLYASLEVLFVGAIIAIIPSLISMITKKDIELPFIPFLSLGIFFVYFYHEMMI